MKRGGPIKRTKGVPKVNRKRKAKRHAEQFGPPGFVEFVHEYGCVVARQGTVGFRLPSCFGAIEAAHVRSRGAGGGWRDNVAGLCRFHHAEQHDMGVDAFEKYYGTDLDLWACAITHQWDLANPDAE
jgi:hypothetical protein